MDICESSKYIAFNSYGGFTKTYDEYHILNPKTPLPWCNILSNENFGTIISSYGTVYTFFKNSQGYKITNWCNDWISSTPGEIFKGIFEENYNLVYGFGYVKLFEEENGINKSMRIFIPPNDNIKIQEITLENTYEIEKEFTIEYKIDPVLGVTKEKTSQYIVSKIEDNILFLKNPYNIDFSEFMPFLGFCSYDNENLEFKFDKYNYSLLIKSKIFPKSKIVFSIILGCNEGNIDEAKKIIEKCNSAKYIDKKYNETINYWREKVVKKYKFKDKYTTIMANGWLLYQTIVCRLFAKSGFYQSGGALGYRDQLQDTLSLIRTWPERTRQQIILHSSKQFEKGDVLHWWHEYNGAGIRTYFSDDYLWLPYVLTEYVEITKDTSILNVTTKYLEDKPMGDKRELYDVFPNIDKEDSVYEHAKKAIKYSLSRVNEKNGLLDIGDGDWNDGFSNIRGQSVWLTFFMMDLLNRFSKLTKIKKDVEMEQICKKKRHMFKHAILENTWDEDHFVRAFFADGKVLGAYENKECKIDLISQAWAVIAMKNDKDMQDELRLALKSTEKYLVDDEHMIVKLLYPSFDNPENDPGYIKAYVPGIRENGGQYTHAAIWLAKAYFELGDFENGNRILHIINPISHSDTKEKADTYMVEPFVVAADIYSNIEHLGRGGWTWYTGSSSWMYKVIEDYLKD